MTANQIEPRAGNAAPDVAVEGSSTVPGNALLGPLATVFALTGLSARQCRWPNGEPGQAGFHFCRARTAVGEVYCVEHLRRSLHRSERRTPGALHRLERARRAAGVADGDRSVRAPRPRTDADARPPWQVKAPAARAADGPAAAGGRMARGLLQRRLFAFLRRQPIGVDLASARDIARMLDLKPETVRAQLSRFEARGWIRRQPFRLLHDPTVDG